jgi:hypothetical protein
VAPLGTDLAWTATTGLVVLMSVHRTDVVVVIAPSSDR